MISFFRRLFRTQDAVPVSTRPESTQTTPKAKNFCLQKLDSERREDGVKVNGFRVLEVKGEYSRSLGHRIPITVSTTVSNADLREAGIYIFKVAGVSHRAEALQGKAFKPGSLLTLVPENNNPYDPNAVSVWDEQRRQMVGYVPREDNQAIRAMLRLHPEYRAICLREYRKSPRRVGLLVMFGPSTVTKEE